MQDLINNLPKLAKDKHKENKSFFAKLKKKATKAIGLFDAGITCRRI